MTRLHRLRAKFEAIDEICELMDELGWIGVAKVFPIDENAPAEVTVDSVQIEHALAQFRKKIQAELFAEENSAKVLLRVE